MNFDVRKTEEFANWLDNLRDRKAAAKIISRVSRVALGNFGDHHSVGEGVSELRLDFGPGYRVYFTKRGNKLVILLCGGDKKSQDRDIKRAKEMAAAI